MEQVQRKHKHAIGAEMLSDDLAKKITKEVFVSTVLLGWKNVTDAEGKDLPFSKENALKLFHDLPDLYEDLVRQSNNANTFKDAEMEVEAKN